MEKNIIKGLNHKAYITIKTEPDNEKRFLAADFFIDENNNMDDKTIDLTFYDDEETFSDLIIDADELAAFCREYLKIYVDRSIK